MQLDVLNLNLFKFACRPLSYCSLLGMTIQGLEGRGTDSLVVAFEGVLSIWLDSQRYFGKLSRRIQLV